MAAYSSRRRLAELLGWRSDPRAATRLTLAPRRLETRRLLDASAPALALELLDASNAFVQTAADPPAAAPSDAAPAAVNSPPTNVQIAPLGAIDEHGVATLIVSFEDADPLDLHRVEVDWGDGAVEVFNLSEARLFGTTHRYLDDGPSADPVDLVNVQVKVIDTSHEAAQASAPLSIHNVAPSDVLIAPMAPIDESGQAALELSFTDPGRLDSHTVEVSWGDGATETFSVDPGLRFFRAMHRYADDAPTGTAADAMPINVRVRDDDGGVALGATTVTVRNVAPSNLQIAPLGTIDENGIGSLSLTFVDPGMRDVHTVQVNWGDGSVEAFQLAPGTRQFASTHQYLDDNPTGTPSDRYEVRVRVSDDDGGAISGSQTLTVNNVAPSGARIAPLASIDENGVANLRLTFSDPGTLDRHTVEVDWGDGSPVETISVSVGARTAAATHRYLDDRPAGAGPATYAIRARVLDDDGGEATADASIEVRNAPPSMLQIAPLGVIDENGLATLSIAFVDLGTLDAHTIDVDWGDGTTESFGVAVGARTLATTHRYLDDNPSRTPADDYLVKVRIRDDDGGSADAGATVTVRNVAPSNIVISPSVIATDEGRVVEIGVTFDDPGSQDDHVYFVNWGDGFESAGGAAGPFSASHIYADNGAYTVTVTLVDDDGGVGVATTTIAVRNVAPTLTVVGNQTVNEGSLLSLTDLGVFTDPGIDNPYNVVGGPTVEQFTYRVDWGDGRPADTGPATIDAPMYLGEPTRGSFDGQHIYADDGTYTVTVTVQDDDGGTDMRLFQVTVRNVDPTLSGLNSLPAVREGDWITLATLGVGVVDPGFDNQLNAGHPSNGGEFEETFTGVTVDWGDGTPADALAVVNRTSGALGVPTTAGFSHAPHVYADNGAYTVTVKLSDDDGGVVVRTFTLVVENVAPVLTLTDESFVRNEGSTLAIARLGDFTDPGFDNPLNGPNASNGGETEETFTYTIDWGDGTVQSGQLPATRTSGSAGTPTTGTLAHSHFYADNDADNRYTITVTLADDDGGVDVKSFEIIVYNVTPTLQPISATDVNKSGQTTLTLAFSDPGADSFQVLVDWGDKLDLPPDQRYVVETAYAGPTPQTFVLTHTYSGPPDPLHPAADIAISVKVRDDDFGIAAVVQPGESNVETVAITNPGTGTQPFRIDTTPQVALLTFPERPAAPVVLAAVDARPVASAAGLIAGASGDSQATGERYLELRVIRPDGTLSPGYRLRPEVLKNLPGLFRNLPDNHYAIYLVQPETDVRRLVVEVFVRNGKLIDPGDDTEGARDRPPTDDATPAARQAPPQPAPPIPEAPPSSDSDAATSPPPARHSSTSMVHRTALVSAALALSGAGRQWQRELDRAKSGARRNSRRTGRSQPKKPR